DFPDGVWFVDLASLSTAALVPQTVATTLQVRETPHQPLLETLSERLRSRHLLLVLDNCEHLLEACGALSEHLLAQCSRLHILATSRRPLSLIGEAAWRVPSLPLPAWEEVASEEKDLASFLLEFDAVRLFVAHARSVSPRFHLHVGNQR